MQNYKEIIVFNPRNFLNDNYKDVEALGAATVNFSLNMVGGVSVNSLFFDPDIQIIIFSANNHLYFFNVMTG